MAAMADVDLQSLVERSLDHRVHLALAIDETAGVARERMGKDIAVAQQRDHALQDGVDVLTVGAAFRQAPELAEMHIDRQIGTTADLGRHFDDANTPAGEAADFGMRLDAANEV